MKRIRDVSIVVVGVGRGECHCCEVVQQATPNCITYRGTVRSRDQYVTAVVNSDPTQAIDRVVSVVGLPKPVHTSNDPSSWPSRLNKH